MWIHIGNDDITINRTIINMLLRDDVTYMVDFFINEIRVLGKNLYIKPNFKQKATMCLKHLI
jgi:hypothetical protein